MDNLNIDFNELFPHVVDAYTEVYGSEYHQLILEKLDRTLIIPYLDFEGLSDYVAYIKRCKAREFSIRFLEEIGIDVQKYKKDNYTDVLDRDIEDILEYYIDSSFFGFSKNADYWAPLKAFNHENNNSKERLLDNKIKLINHLLGNDQENITKDNFDSFSQTNEYLELLEKIKEYSKVYERLYLEFKEWEVKLKPYEEYVDYERKRKTDILEKKKNEIFAAIYDKIPEVLKNIVSNKTLEEQQNAILGSRDIETTFIIETFRQEQMEKLKSLDVSLYDKFWIVLWQSNYLKNIGVSIPDENMLKCDTEDDVIKYLEFINQDDIRKYLPSEELISYIRASRERKYEEALREYYTTRKDFIDTMKMFADNQTNFDSVYYQIKNRKVCILGEGGLNDENEFISIMFFTIQPNNGGYLFHTFMHECGHVIDQNREGCGFESCSDFSENSTKNPYDSAYRKYEKFNETIRDMFTMEAVNYLHNKGIYLIESKEFTKSDASDHNTALITKDLLRPLLQKFRSYVINAQINAKSEYLTKYIGEDNFEELVDAVNKVDYLVRNGVKAKINEHPEDPMVIEYFEQVERVKQIYVNIDEYYANNYEAISRIDNTETVRKI